MVLHATCLAINDIVHSAILFPGLNLNQFMRFCNFVGIKHMSPTTYYCFQRLYTAPTVEQEYNAMEADLIQLYLVVTTE